MNNVDWWHSQMEKCPDCGWYAELGNDALTGKYIVFCKNCTCGNHTFFIDESWGKAIVKWNRWARRI